MNITISRFGTALFAVLIFLGIFNFSSIQFFENQRKSDALSVNVSGRNRSLSQKIAFLAHSAITGNKTAKEDLQKAIDLHENSLAILQSGGQAPGFSKGSIIPAAPKELTSIFSETQQVWMPFKDAGEAILSDAKSAADKETALQYLVSHAEPLLQQDNKLVQRFVQLSQAKQESVQWLLLATLLVNIGVLIIGLLAARKFLLKPISRIAAVSEEIANGQTDQTLEDHNDPLMQNISTSINLLGSNIAEAADFAQQIGNGQFDVAFKEGASANKLFEELEIMREKLRKVAHEDDQRNWASSGLNQLSGLLRENQDETKQWADKILSHLVSYIGANQGAFYTLSDQDKANPHMKRIACYAWDRIKHGEESIEPGEGLIGQAWLEGEMIYMTDVPDNYIRITSGLGTANPGCILIVPMMVNEEIVGMLEFAGFTPFDDATIGFVQNACESVASALSSFNTNQRTRQLLRQSQRQTEEMRAQEEEMRQNMEELHATQEEMGRKQAEVDSTMDALESIVPMATWSADGILQKANDQFLEALNTSNSMVLESSHDTLFSFTQMGHSWKSMNLENNKGSIVEQVQFGNAPAIEAKYLPIIDAQGKLQKVLQVLSASAHEMVEEPVDEETSKA